LAAAASPSLPGINKTGAGALTFNNAVNAASVALGAGTTTIGSTAVLTSPLISVGGSAALTIASGGALGAASGLVANGAVTFNTAAQTLATLGGLNSGILNLNGTVLNVTGNSSYDGMISGTGSIVKNTPGTLTLSGATNDFTGGITISAGAVQLGGITAGGTNPVRVNVGGILAMAVPGVPSMTPIILNGGIIGSVGGQTIGADVTVSSDSIVNVFNPISGVTPNDLIITGSLLGTGNLEVISQNGNAPDGSAFRLRGPTSNYRGTITVRQSGKFELQTSDATGSQMGTGILVVTGGTTTTTGAGTYSIINLRNNSGGDVVFGNDVRVIGTGTSFMNLLGNSPAGSSVAFGDLLIGDGQAVGAVATASQDYTVAFATVHLNGGNITFTPQPLGNTNFLSVENIRLGTITQNAPSGITMNGAATLTFAGPASYTGATIVNSGTLEVNGSLTGSSGVAVNGGGLTGRGTIVSAVKIGDGDPALAATINAGGVNAIGTLTTGALDLNSSDAQFQLEINSSDLTKDQVVVNGALTLGAGVAAFMPTDLGTSILGNSERFVVATATGGVAGFFNGLPQGATVTVGNNALTISYQNNAITLVAIPEPAAAASLLASLIGVIGLPRRRRHA
jgi:autotransporter-associated beta strand protein